MTVKCDCCQKQLYAKDRRLRKGESCDKQPCAGRLRKGERCQKWPCAGMCKSERYQQRPCGKTAKSEWWKKIVEGRRLGKTAKGGEGCHMGPCTKGL